VTHSRRPCDSSTLRTALPCLALHDWIVNMLPPIDVAALMRAEKKRLMAVALWALQSLHTSYSATAVAGLCRSLMGLVCRLEFPARAVSALLLSRSRFAVTCARPCGLPTRRTCGPVSKFPQLPLFGLGRPPGGFPTGVCQLPTGGCRWLERFPQAVCRRLS
jgi:hypothetical protein